MSHGRTGSSPVARTTKKDICFADVLFCGFRRRRAAPPFGIKMLGAAEPPLRRRPEGRLGGPPILFRDFKISILAVPSKKRDMTYVVSFFWVSPRKGLLPLRHPLVSRISEVSHTKGLFSKTVCACPSILHRLRYHRGPFLHRSARGDAERIREAVRRPDCQGIAARVSFQNHCNVAYSKLTGRIVEV